jgi:hypothetical protein
MVKVEMAVDEENLEIFVCVSGIEVVPNGGCPGFSFLPGLREEMRERPEIIVVLAETDH